jgi:hypothetical protein
VCTDTPDGDCWYLAVLEWSSFSDGGVWLPLVLSVVVLQSEGDSETVNVLYTFICVCAAVASGGKY